MGMSNTREAVAKYRPTVVVIAAIFLFSNAFANSARWYDDYLSARPWISATVEIVPVEGDLPLIRYGVLAPVQVQGIWRAWLDVDGVRTCSGFGQGSYGPKTPVSRLWEWSDWIGNDCSEPRAPYRACVSYNVHKQSGAHDEFGPFCSTVRIPE